MDKLLLLIVQKILSKQRKQKKALNLSYLKE